MAAATEPGVHTVTAEECWHLLETADLGRVGVVLGDGVDIFPVNFVVKNQIIYFRSAPGSKLVEITKNPLVAFEADGIADRQRWSVVVRGQAARLNSDAEIEESGVRSLHTLTPTTKWNYIRIDPAVVSGRRFTSAHRSN